MSYPQDGHFPTLDPPDANGLSQRQLTHKKSLLKQALKTDVEITRRRLATREAHIVPEAQLERRAEWKRQLAARPPGTIDATYGCDLYDQLIDYALTSSLPWSMSSFVLA